MQTIKIMDHENLERDLHSKAILQTDTIALSIYKKKQELNNTVNKLKEDVEDIKNTLSKIISILEKGK